MDISYDAAKDRANRRRHGISLAEAARMNWSAVLERLDDRNDYGEDRYTALGLIEDRVYFVVYVDWGEIRRVISLRKANTKECRDYENGK
jgi:uncharacterized DUF497 family protein